MSCVSLFCIRPSGGWHLAFSVLHALSVGLALRQRLDTSPHPPVSRTVLLACFPILQNKEEVAPVLFVTGAGMTPVQASSRNMETHSAVLQWVQVVATPGASPVTSTRDLESKCLKKERCALILKAGPLHL